MLGDDRIENRLGDFAAGIDWDTGEIRLIALLDEFTVTIEISLGASSVTW
jgi:hypothetical protein